MVSFYRKLAASDQGAPLAGGHPSAARRLSMAQGMARLFAVDQQGGSK
jgi:predicted Zn-dependent protease